MKTPRCQCAGSVLPGSAAATALMLRKMLTGRRGCGGRVAPTTAAAASQQREGQRQQRGTGAVPYFEASTAYTANDCGASLTSRLSLRIAARGATGGGPQRAQRLFRGQAGDVVAAGWTP